MNDDTQRWWQQCEQYVTNPDTRSPIPPRSMVDRPITPDDIRAYPAFFWWGPGRTIAETTNCGHGYTMTSSCPGCDADCARTVAVTDCDVTATVVQFGLDTGWRTYRYYLRDHGQVVIDGADLHLTEHDDTDTDIAQRALSMFLRWLSEAAVRHEHQHHTGTASPVGRVFSAAADAHCHRIGADAFMQAADALTA